MNNDLSILISGRLDETKTTQSINQQIKALSSKLDTLQLNFSDTDFKSVTNKVKQLQDQINSMSKNTKIVDNQEVKAQTAGFVTEVNKAVDDVKKKLGSINNLKTSVNLDKNGELKGFIIQVEDAQKQVQKFKYVLDTAFQETGTPTFKLDNNNIVNANKISKEIEKIKSEFNSLVEEDRLSINQINRMNDVFKNATDVKSLETLKNAMAQVADEAKLAQQMSEGAEKARTQRVLKEISDQKKLDENQAKTANSNIDRIKKEQQAQDELNKKLIQQLELYKREAIVKAKNLERQFGNSVNESAIKRYLSDVEALNVKTPELQHQMRSLNTSFKEISANAKTAGSHVLTMGEALKTAMSRFPIWMAAATAFYFPLRQFQSGLQQIKQLNDAMTNLKKVTNETSQQYQEFIGQATQSANSIGAATTDFINSTTDFARLGYSIQQAKALAKQAMTYANVGDMSQEDATKALISSMKAFNIQADAQGKNLQKVVDLYNQIGNMEAITSSGIGEAMRRSASSLKDAGNTIQQAVALITAANSVVQDPSTVGTAWKTVSMRLRGISDSGKQVAGLVPKLEGAFNKLGISIKQNNNTFKSTYEIMDELAGKWKNLSDFQKANITELIAGKRQGNIIASALDNWKVATRTLKEGMNSAGSSAKELNVYLDSIDAKLNQLKNADMNFWHDAISTSSVKEFVSALTGLLNGLDSIVKHFGLLPPVVAAATAGILIFNKSLRKSASLSSMYAWDLLTGKLNRVKVAAEGAAVAEGELAAASEASGLMTSLGEATTGVLLPVAAITALSFGIEKLIGHYQKLNQQQQQFKQESDKMLSDYTTNQDQLNKKLQEYYDLSSKKQQNGNKLSVQESKKYQDVQNQINKLMPSLTQKIKSNGDAHLKSADAIKTEIQYVKELQKNKEKLAAVTYKDSAKDIADNIGKLISNLKQVEQQAKQTSNTYYYDKGVTSTGRTSVTVNKSDEQKVKDQTQVIYTQHQLALAIQQAQEKAKSQVSAFLALDQAASKLSNSDQKLISSFISEKEAGIKNNQWKKDAQKTYEGLVNSATAYGEAIAKLRNVVGSGVDLSFTKGLNPTQISGLSDLIKEVESGQAPLSKFASLMKGLGFTAQQTDTVLKALSATQKDNAQSADAAAQAQNILNNILKNTGATTDEVAQITLGYGKQEVDQATSLVQVYNALSQVKNKDAQQQALYNQVVAKLMEMFPGLVKGHEVNIKAIENEVNAKEVLYQATIEAANGQLNAEQQKTLASIKGTNKRIEEMKKEIDALEVYQRAFNEAVASMKSATTGLDRQRYETISRHWYTRMVSSGNIADLSRMKNELNSLESGYYTGISNFAKSINFTPTFRTPEFKSSFPVPKTKKPKKKKTKTPQQPVEQYKTNKFEQALASLDVQLQESQDRLDNYNQTSKAYRDELDKQINILKQKRTVTNNEIGSLDRQTASLKHQLSSMGSFNRLSNDQKKKYNDIAQQIDNNISKVNSLKTSYADLGQQIQEAQKKITDVYSNIAQDVVDVYKQAYQEMEQIALDANQKQLDRLQQLHDKKIQLLDDEMKKYQDSINQRLAEIDKKENQDKYEQQLSQKKQARQQTLSEIERMSMDTSIEGQKKVHDLKVQLTQQDLDIKNFVHQHDVALRKQNLQDQLSAKQKEVDNAKKAEDTKFNQLQTELQKERQAIQKHWENLINDDRHWTKIQNDILSGHLNSIQKDLSTFSSTMKSHMSEIGTSISHNLIDKISKAQQELRALNNTPAPGHSGGSSGHSSSSGSSHHSSGSSSHHSSSSHKNSSKPSRKGTYYTVKPGDTYSEIAMKFYGHAYPEWHKIGDANHFKPRDIPIGARIFIPFASGGYTGTWGGNEGRVALLHQKEQILNKDDTSNLFAAVRLLRSMINTPNQSIPNVNHNNSNSTTVHMDVHIGTITGGKEAANDFFGTINEHLHRRGVNLNWS